VAEGHEGNWVWRAGVSSPLRVGSKILNFQIKNAGFYAFLL